MKRVSMMAVMLLMAGAASAVPVVSLELVLDGAGGFAILADASGLLPGQANGGISGFNLVVPGHLGATNMSPKGLDLSIGGFRGFQLTGDTWAPGADLFDGQNTSNPASLLYNVGITPVDIPGAILTRGLPAAFPVLLAVGQGEPDYTQITGAVNVFTDVGSDTVVSADVIIGGPSTIADADGPYVINEGDPLLLDASGSLYTDSYAWDLDDDGSFETSAGSSATLSISYAQLQSLGLGVGGPYDIHLEADGYRFDYDSTTLTILPEPATLLLLAAAAPVLLRRKR